MSRGIFRLKQVYEEQLSGQWSTRGDVWNAPSPFLTSKGFDTAYFAGGPASSQSASTVERIDYSNDTAAAVAKGPLTGGRYSHRGTGNSDFGYHGGGRPSPHNQVERIDYSNDAATAAVKGPLSGTHYSHVAAGNQSFGYFIGGFSTVSRVSRIDYSNDTATASQKGPLSTGRGSAGATGNQNFGYIGGGTAPGYTSDVERIDYSNDSATASPKGPLNFAKYRLAGTGNADFGYLTGGGHPSVPDAGTTVERIDYSNDTATVSLKGQLNNPHSLHTATGNQNFGYIAGGFPSSSTKIDRIDYSNDTASALDKGFLISGRFQLSASSSRAYANPTHTLNPALSPRPNLASAGTDFGYFGAGSYPTVSSYKSTVDRIDFNNDTATASPKGNLSRTTQNHGGASSNTGGYFFGRFPAASTVDRIDYSNDTATASPKGKLSVARGYVASTGNNDFGYTGGEYPSGSTVDRLDYSNDTANAVGKGPLSVARWALATTGNQSFGYFMGGVTPAGVTTVDRIDYSNDTPTASPKGPLDTTNNYNAAATGNANFGYVTVGNAPHNSKISRIDYSNDTATAAPKGPLISARSYRGATGNSNFGYFSGGQESYTTVHSDISRIDYSNDTATALSKGNLSIAKNKHAGVSSRQAALPAIGPGILEVPVSFGAFSVSTPQGTDFGYFGGGNTPRSSTVDRVDYSNDTATASVRGPLSLSRGLLGAAGNASGGYFGGGVGITHYSTVNRVNYSNDTETTAVKGGLTRTGYGFGAAGNINFGYWGGGFTPSADSTVDRIDYSNDTATASPKGPLSLARKELAATGNQSFGYFAGGGPAPFPGGFSTVDRVDYSNDTATASPKGSLTVGIRKLAAAGNANFGYIGGGLPPTTSLVDRIDYSNDTAAASPKGPLTVARYDLYATGSSSFGYFAAGYNDGGTNLSLIDRVDYANDTATAVAKGPLSVARVAGQGVSSRENGIPTINTVNYAAGTLATPNTGYFTGGLSPGSVSTVDRLDYSSDTGTMVTKGPLSVARYGGGSTSNASFGYIAGGTTPETSIVDRVDYLNDTSTALQRGPLTSAKSYVNGVGNVNFGYISGGDLTTVDRIDYSSDTATASPKGPLNNARRYISAVGNQDFGYFAGGGNPRISSVDRIDYSNDTATASPKGPLSEVKSSAGATGNASFGYFGAGSNGSNVSTVERLDYSNDTSTSIRGPLTTARFIGEGATGTASSGYFAGGGPGTVSTVERIDYNNDTATAVVKGPLSDGRNLGGAVSARECGFVPIGPAVVANSPVQVQTGEEEGGGGSSSSIFSKLVSLVTTLSNATVPTAANLQSIQSLIESADSSFNVFAVVGRDDYAESLSGTGVAGGKRTHTAKGFNYNSSSSNIISTGSEIVDMSGGSSSSISGGSVIDGKKWMAMAQFDGTNFDGILLWIFTGDSINSSGTITSEGRTVTNTRDIFYPAGTGSTDYHHIYPIAIAADGTIYSNVTSGKSGWNFSNGTGAQSATGYNSSGNMSGDDGVWAFVISTGSNSFYADGNSPGTNPKTTSYPSFGMGNYNSGDGNSDTYWNGTNTANNDNLGFVFTGDA